MCLARFPAKNSEGPQTARPQTGATGGQETRRAHRTCKKLNSLDSYCAGGMSSRTKYALHFLLAPQQLDGRRFLLSFIQKRFALLF